MPQVLNYDDQVGKFIHNVRAEYEADSIIWNRFVVESRAATSSDMFKFVQIGSRFSLDVEVFTSSSHYPGLIGAGHSVALGEEAYLVEMLNRQVSRRVEKNNLSSQSIVEALCEMGPNFHPNAVLVPIAFHNPLHLEEIPGLKLVYDPHERRHRGPILKIDKSFETPEVFWSNKYVPFDSLMFVDKSIGEWVVKTQDGHYLTVDVPPAGRIGKVGVVIKTIPYFNIATPERGLILKIRQS